MPFFTSKPKREPARLYPKKEESWRVKICRRILPILLTMIIIMIIVLCLTLFVKVCFAIVPAPESGLWYNHVLNGGYRI